MYVCIYVCLCVSKGWEGSSITEVADYSKSLGPVPRAGGGVTHRTGSPALTCSPA